MAAHGEAVLRLRICVSGDCRAVFFICAHCDRGHRYCSRPAAPSPGAGSGVAPTAAISKALKAGSITGTGNGSTGSAPNTST
jgi:hypothetical protein